MILQLFLVDFLVVSGKRAVGFFKTNRLSTNSKLTYMEAISHFWGPVSMYVKYRCYHFPSKTVLMKLRIMATFTSQAG